MTPRLGNCEYNYLKRSSQWQLPPDLWVFSYLNTNETCIRKMALITGQTPAAKGESACDEWPHTINSGFGIGHVVITGEQL